MANILAFGWWSSSKNIGDKAIFLGIKKAFKDHNILTLPANLRFRKEPIRKLNSYINSFRKADLVLMTGGTPLYDYGHLMRTFLMSMPKILNKPFVLFGIGTKPIKSFTGKLLIKKLVNKADIISVRDPITEKILKTLGVKREIKVTGDSAFLLNPAPRNKIKRLMRKEDINSNFIAVCPRKLSLDWKAHYHQKLTKREINLVRKEFIKKVKNKEGEKVIIPFHKEPYDNDLEEVKYLNSDFKILKDSYTPQEILGLISQSKFLVGLRLHSLIFAYMRKVEFETVNYDIKIKGFRELIETFSKKEIITNIKEFVKSTRDLL